MDRKKLKNSLETLEEHTQARKERAEQHLYQMEDGVADLYQKLEDGVYNAYKVLETGALRATDTVMDLILGKEDKDDQSKK